MEKTKILVIDDNEALVEMIEEYFSLNGSIEVVLKAYSGEEGIQIIENNINDYQPIISQIYIKNYLIQTYLDKAVFNIIINFYRL